jgi:hypothetical protein
MAQFEYRCLVHGRICDVDMDLPPEQSQLCPVKEGEVSCALPLFLAEVGSMPSDEE